MVLRSSVLGGFWKSFRSSGFAVMDRKGRGKEWAGILGGVDEMGWDGGVRYGMVGIKGGWNREGEGIER